MWVFPAPLTLLFLGAGASCAQSTPDFTRNVEVAVTLVKAQPACALTVSNSTLDFGTHEISWPGTPGDITASPGSGVQATLSFSNVTSYAIAGAATGGTNTFRALTGPQGKRVDFLIDLDCRSSVHTGCSRSFPRQSGSVSILIGGTVRGNSFGLPGTPAGTYSAEFDLTVTCGG